MATFLLVVAAIGFLVSLLPFLYPGSVVSMFGLALNHWLGVPLATHLGLANGSLVLGAGGAATTLTLSGVLALYLPALLILIFVVRGR